MRDFLTRVDFALNSVEMLVAEVGFHTLSQDVQKKINSSILNLEEAFEILEEEVEKHKVNSINELYLFIEHGGDEHKAWLKEALQCFFHGQPKPEYKA